MPTGLELSLMPMLKVVVGLPLTAIVFLAVFKCLRSSRKRIHGLPPGPNLDPIIGHLRLVDPEQPWKTFAKWGDKWGNVIYTSVFSKPMVILNSAEAVREVLDRRGALSRDRPRQVLFAETLGWGNLLSVMYYGEAWRRHRRIMQQSMNSQSVKRFESCQAEQTLQFLGDLCVRPEYFGKCIDRFTASLIIKAIYGFDIEDEDDILASTPRDATSLSLAEGQPGFSIYDIVPALMLIPSWFPGGGFKKRLENIARKVSDMVEVPFALVQNRRVEGVIPTEVSFVDEHLDYFGAKKSEATPVDRELFFSDLKSVAGVIVATGAVLATFFLLLARNPEVVKKAHSKIDQTIGRERLPTFSDRKSIPYIDCIMKEVLRFNAPAPLGLPHNATEDIVHKGMVIPKDTQLLANIWKMLNDERFFPESDDFRPERFRSKVEGMADNIESLNGQMFDDPSALVFGFGRRICPGRYFADSTLWLAMAQTLAVFDITSPLDATGKPQIPEIAFESGTVLHPKQFECVIKPRDGIAVRLVRGEQQA